MALYTYKPILSLVQDACVRLNLEKPQGVYDSLDEHAIYMGSIATEIGQMLMELAKDPPWQQFVHEFSITGDGVATGFAFPADLASIVNNTGWSLANRRPVLVITPAQWNAVRSWLSTSFFINPACRIFDDELQFLTPPALGEVVTFEYLSKNWVIDGTNPAVLKETLDNNADIPMFDATLFTLALRIRWLQVRGMSAVATLTDFGVRLSQMLGKGTLAQNLSLNSGNLGGFKLLDASNVPDTNFGPP